MSYAKTVAYYKALFVLHNILEKRLFSKVKS